MPDVVARRGRGFSDVAAENHIQEANPTDKTAGRLLPPEFPDEDLEGLVQAARLPFPRTSRLKQSNEQVRLPTLTTTMSQKEEQRSPKRVKPGHQTYLPPCRRVTPMSDHVVADQLGGVPADISTMDFSKVTNRETELQTLEQTGWPLNQALKIHHIGSVDDQTHCTLHTQNSPRRRPTKGRKPPGPFPTPNGVLIEALKSLQTSDPSCMGQKSATMAMGTATAASPKYSHEQASQFPPPIIAIGSNISEKSQKEIFITKQDMSMSLSEANQDGQAQKTRGGVVLSEDFVFKPEMFKQETIRQQTLEAKQHQGTEGSLPFISDNFEPYHLAPDERFASESSAESESVTSTICDYEDISQSDGGESDECSPPVKKRKARRKRQGTETSDGKVYYPISEGDEAYVPLSFQIPDRELLRLVSLKEGSKMRVWNHCLYEFGDKKIDVQYCTTFEQFEAAARRFLAEKVIGFDMEWLARPSKKVWWVVSLPAMS